MKLNGRWEGNHFMVGDSVIAYVREENNRFSALKAYFEFPNERCGMPRDKYIGEPHKTLEDAKQAVERTYGAHW